VAKHSPRRKVRERSEAADSHPLSLERFHSPNLRQRRKLVFNNSQAPDDYHIRAAQSGGNRRRAGGGQDLHFAGDEAWTPVVPLGMRSSSASIPWRAKIPASCPSQSGSRFAVIDE